MSAALLSAIGNLPMDARLAFMRHLDGSTSADYLAEWLTRWGQPVSATTIRTHRRAQTKKRA